MLLEDKGGATPIPAKRKLQTEDQKDSCPTDMTNEIQSSGNFLTHLLTLSDLKRNANITDNHFKIFNQNLVDVLKHRYKNHWYPQNSFKGSGFRAIRINSTSLDPIVGLAAELSGIEPELVHNALPREVTIWCDPFKTDVRIGENGSIMTIYDYCNPILNKIWRPKTCKKDNYIRKSHAIPIIHPDTLAQYIVQ